MSDTLRVDDTALDAELETAAGLVRPIRVHGELANRLAVVERAGASLLVGLGTVVDHEHPRTVLVPYVELSLHEQEDDAETAVFDASMPFLRTVAHENAAFVIMRLSSDFEDACCQLKAVSLGGIKPEPNRIQLARLYVERARRHLEGCLRELDLADAEDRTAYS